MASLSASYEKTLALTQADKQAQAREEFHGTFVPAIKKLYSEAGTTYPVRYSKASDWCTWAKALYTLSAKADQALGKPDAGESLKQLGSLREHFFNLHQDTKTQKVNDAIYAFRVEAARDQPSAAQLQALAQAVEKAEPSAKAKADPRAFTRAKAQWSEQVSACLKSAALAGADLQRLRSATETFYSAFGVQFE